MPLRRRQRRTAPPTTGHLDVPAAYGAGRRPGPRESKRFDVDREIARLAGPRGGVVARRELLALGVSARAIGRRVEAGRLYVIHRGVYAVGHPDLTWTGHAHAAQLAVGAGVASSFSSAGIALRVLPAGHGPQHVTAIGRVPRSRPGIVVHSARELDVIVVDGLRVTTPARTLLDLASVLDHAALDRALGEAQVLKLVTEAGLRAQLRRHPSHHGARALARALGTAAPTRSELERRFLSIIDRAGLPRPRTNVRIGRFEVDAFWPDERVIVEADGWASHGPRPAFERDRARDAELHARGYVVLRFTWRQITEEPLLVAATIARVLSNRSADVRASRR
jgi:very-short-patch-repair endonuclease